ncbi:ribosome-inactivating family protein [Spiroplasma endosymbiont of Eupeodes luniger]|uniref:ribosome-inactivating family protein n=1 Tax=Spiroplasma endosymbiont of Eupeodes luniger TaxID=3066300 RepID=UPI0030CF0B75
MKKLLGILGTITIAGSGISGIVGNAPTSAKNEINSLQTSSNNLEKLNRNKRDINSIFKTEAVNVDWNTKDYFKNLCNKVLKSLLSVEIILSISDSSSDISVVCDANYYVINSNSNYNFFIVPFNIESRGTIELVFRVSDFYLQGFTYNTDFYRFSDSTITNIRGQNSYNLGFDSNYNTIVSGDPTISWTGITQAFNDLFNYGSDARYRNNNNIIRAAFARVILATAESMRFREVRRLIQNNTNNYWQTNFYNIITNWASTTQNAINYLTENGNLNNFISRNIILIFSSAMLEHLHQCNNRNARSTAQNNLMCFNKKETSESDCHVFASKNYIPIYGTYHQFDCILFKTNTIEL